MANADSHATVGETYNRVYERLSILIGPNNDILLFAAYGLYKAEKREWVIDFCTREGRRPVPAELAGFTSTITDARLRSFKNDAERILKTFSVSVVEQKRADIMSQAIGTVELKMMECHRESIGKLAALKADILRNTFWADVRANLMASAMWIALVGAIFFLIEIGALEKFKIPGSKQVEKHQTP